jgi:hypothetical protein
MKAWIRRSGGVGGFVQAVDVETDDLDNVQRERAEQALSSDRLEQAAAKASDPFMTDAYQYELVTPTGTYQVDAGADTELEEFLNELIDGRGTSLSDEPPARPDNRPRPV